MRTRIAVLNDEIYKISEGTFNIVMGFNRGIFKGKLNRLGYNSKLFHKQHQKSCDRIRKYGKKILEADVMLRDD